MDVINRFLTDALQSDFFAGGLALGVFGIAAATFRVGLLALHRIIMKRVWVSLTLDNRSAAYRHFCIWMEHNNVLAKSRHVRMTDGRWASGTKGYAPAPGRHWFFWRGNPTVWCFSMPLAKAWGRSGTTSLSEQASKSFRPIVAATALQPRCCKPG